MRPNRPHAGTMGRRGRSRTHQQRWLLGRGRKGPRFSAVSRSRRRRQGLKSIRERRARAEQSLRDGRQGLGSLAGLAVFVYVVGGLTVLARLRRIDLPAEVVIPKIPRERAYGLAQLLWTLVLGGLVAALAIWLLPAREPEETWRQWSARLVAQDKRKWIPAVFGLAAIVLIAPLSVNGLAYVGILLLGVVSFVAWSRRRGRLVSFLVALLLAGAVTVLRQLEFPTPFAGAEVTLAPGKAPLIPEAHDGLILARVVETTNDEILLSYQSPENKQLKTEKGIRQPPRLLVIPRDSVARIRYQLPPNSQSQSNSIAQELVGFSPPPLPLMCLIPTCEWDATNNVELAEPTASPPFVF